MKLTSRSLFIFILCVGMLLKPTVSSAAEFRSDFTLGINGHPMVQAAYINTPIMTQIQLLKSMGAKIYRVDFSTAADGVIKQSNFDTLRIAAAQNGIEILPVLSAWSMDYSLDETTNYNLGKTLGTNFAHLYGQYFDHYELGNEIDNDLILPNKTGASQNDYNLTNLKLAAAYLKGMDEGIKSQDPGAQTMVDAGWLHYAYLLKLQEYGVNFDIVAYHWYSNMEKLALQESTPITDITAKLSSKFSKPIWFTEVGQQYSATNPNLDNDQNAFLTSFLTKAENNPQVKALVFYELLDQPALIAQEAHYGLTKWTSAYSTYANKPIADTLMVMAGGSTTPVIPPVVIPPVVIPPIIPPVIPPVIVVPGGGGGGSSSSSTPVTNPGIGSSTGSNTGSSSGTPTTVTPPTMNTYAPGECLPGALFSKFTGMPCMGANNTSFPTSQAVRSMLTKNLKPGYSDTEVKMLQQYLNTHGFIVSTSGVGSPGYESNYFGAKTKTALYAFQRASGLSTGYVGPITRAYINSH